MFTIEELKLIAEWVGIGIDGFEGCQDLTTEYILLKKVKKIINEHEGCDINEI